MNSSLVVPRNVQRTATASNPQLVAMKNTLIATISTFLSHYFNSRFLQSGWLTEYRRESTSASDPASVTRRVLEMKTRFLYCLLEAMRALHRYEKPFDALAAFKEDTITESLEIISTPEREFNDELLNRCTEVMATDISTVKLTEAVCGQFLRRILQLVRQELRDSEHLKYLYLFCAWRMPEVLFDRTVAAMVQRREVRSLLADPRLPQDLISALRAVRGNGVFGPPSDDGDEVVDEGWDIEQARMKAEPLPKRRAWHGLFSRSKRRNGDAAR